MDVLEAVAGRLVVIGGGFVIAYLGYFLAREMAADRGLRATHIAGFISGAAIVAVVAAGRLGTITDTDGDPLRPATEVYDDPDRPPVTTAERQEQGVTIFALLTIPAAFGFNEGRKAHAEAVTERTNRDRTIAERLARIAGASACSTCGEPPDDRCPCCGAVLCGRCHYEHTRHSGVVA